MVYKILIVGFGNTVKTVFIAVCILIYVSNDLVAQPRFIDPFSRTSRYGDHLPFAIKINTLYGTIANLGGEILFNDYFSLDLPVCFSPYNLSQDRKMRLLAFQPEFRYWIKTPIVVGGRFWEHSPGGHFVGLHAHVAWFNMAFGGDERYQDNTPVLGAGISYGYALLLSRRWGVEFTLGAGYAHISYDKYANIPNGKKTGNGKINYWGITRAGISFSYRFKTGR